MASAPGNSAELGFMLAGRSSRPRVRPESEGGARRSARGVLNALNDGPLANGLDDPASHRVGEAPARALAARRPPLLPARERASVRSRGLRVALREDARTLAAASRASALVVLLREARLEEVLSLARGRAG